jgi:hypothetical protein
VPDPVDAVRQALIVLEQALRPLQSQRPEQVGLVDMHGNVTWFTGRSASAYSPRATLITTDCNATLRGRLAVGEEEGHLPVLAVVPTSDATYGRLTLSVDEGGRLVKYLEEDLYVLADTVAAASASVDFSDFHRGASGQIELELFDSAGEQIMEPLIEEFIVVTQQALSGLAQPV